ncbi:hypothetical protein Efla_003956 [Eimeria flavescens]
MDSTSFPLLRITILGSGGCGKTSIADVFVNNAVERPNPPPPTDFPQLLYKVVRLADEGGGEVRSYCCEIEDTFDASRTDGGRNIRSLVDMKRKMLMLPRGVRDFSPFALWKPPLTPLTEREKYRPIAHGRMGFLIVFDVTDPASFNKATELYDLPIITPVIFLVANKTDVDPQGDTTTRLMGRAELYAQQVFCRLWHVSAFTGKNIKKMFVDMIQLIFANGMLWELDYQEANLKPQNPRP